MEMTAAVRLIMGYMTLKNKSQREVAYLIGTDEAQLSKWLSGKHNPCRAWQMRIAEVLGEIARPQVGKMERRRKS
jgi:transcriptional regulator with XRE-family HTH domain